MKIFWIALITCGLVLCSFYTGRNLIIFAAASSIGWWSRAMLTFAVSLVEMVFAMHALYFLHEYVQSKFLFRVIVALLICLGLGAGIFYEVVGAEGVNQMTSESVEV